MKSKKKNFTNKKALDMHMLSYNYKYAYLYTAHIRKKKLKTKPDLKIEVHY